MLMVLLYHCWLFGGTWHIGFALGRHTINLASALSFGHIGVNLFLVISGFCLYWPFVKSNSRKEPTLWEFAKKRCRRILPPYYATLLIFGALPIAQAWHHLSSVNWAFALNWFWLHAVMAHNLRPAYILSLNGSLWSLGLEFQLYILFPALVEAYRRFSARGVLLSVFAGSTIYRFVVAHGNFLPDDGFGYVLAYSVFGRCFEFALGMFAAKRIAQWHRSGKSPFGNIDYLFPALIVPLAVFDGRHGHFQTLTDAMWGLLFTMLLVMASRPETYMHSWLSNRWLVSCGIFSYSVYLIHLPLVIGLGAFAMHHHFSNAIMILFELVFVVPLMIGLGYVFHLLFEKPFMGPPRQRKAVVLAAAPAMEA